jgi:hypothetical protein
MEVTLSMYDRMGFHLQREVPAIGGVSHGIYALELRENTRQGAEIDALKSLARF